MRRLAIETAAAACSVALFDEDQLIAERHERGERGHAERLIPMIAELPEGGRADAIIVDCGPGSFTGIRVGIAAAKGLGLAWDIPVHGYSSLSLIAASAAARSYTTLAVAIAGGHGQLFVQRFKGNPVHPLTEVASLPPQEAAAALPDPIVLGDAAALIVEQRGWGEAIAGEPIAARHVMALPAALRSLPASPLYGRAPDAKPMSGNDGDPGSH